MAMRYGLTLLTPPGSEPVTRDEAKQHTRIEFDNDNALFDSLLTTARRYVERTQNRTLMTATWQATFDHFPYGSGLVDVQRSSINGYLGRRNQQPRWPDWTSFRIPRPPLQSVTSIVYIDMNGNTQTLDPSLYLVDATQDPGRINPAYAQSWPIARQMLNAITITFVAGYGAASAIPEAYKTAIKMLVTHWYRNREAVSYANLAELPLGMSALLASEWAGEYT